MMKSNCLQFMYVEASTLNGSVSSFEMIDVILFRNCFSEKVHSLDAEQSDRRSGLFETSRRNILRVLRKL